MCIMELAPKGTGKSYLYENINQMCGLLSGGNISPACSSTMPSGRVGAIGPIAVAVLDEVETLNFHQPDVSSVI